METVQDVTVFVSYIEAIYMVVKTVEFVWRLVESAKKSRNVTIALSGVSARGEVGVLTPNIEVALR